MDLARHAELDARLRVEDAFEGGEGTSLVVAPRDGGHERLLLKLLPRGADLHEAGLLASLVHPRIPHVREVGRTEDGTPYVLRALAPGRPLSELAPLAPARAVELCTALLEILAFVHLRGILHLDLKPQNVLVDAGEAGAPDPWLVDFGMGRRGTGAARGGTPFFAAPELLLGLEPDARADLFSLGATMAAVLVPDVGRRLADFLRRFPREDFFTAAGLDPSELPAPFDRLLPRLCARRPEERFADAQEALEALRHGGSGRPSVAALAIDAVTAHGAAIERVLAVAEPGTDVRIAGAEAEDREAVALQIACGLGDVRATVHERRSVVLRRGSERTRELQLPPLDEAAIAAHLERALGLDAGPAAAAASALRAAGAVSAASASRLLRDLAESGAIVPDGVGWTWPDALTGRLDLSRAPEPESPDALCELAARGRIEAALSAYRTRAATEPGDEPRWRTALARGLVLAGEPLRALPLAHDAADVRARCLLDLGRIDDAAAILDELDGDDDAVLRVQAGVRYERGAFEDGLRALEAAATADPQNRVMRAYLLSALGRPDDAESELEAALEALDAGRAPFPRAAALTARGDLARRTGHPDDARAHHDEALALYRALGNVRNTASAAMNLGVVLKDLGRLDEARDALRRARALFDHVEDTASSLLADANLGIVQLAAGDASSAVERFDRAIPGLRALGVTRSDALLRALRARALAQLGDLDRARSEIASLESELGATPDDRLRSELDAARSAVTTVPTHTAPMMMTSTPDEIGAVPRTVFRSFLAVNRRLASEHDLEKAMHHLLEAAETVTGARASYLLVEREGTVTLEVASRIGPAGDRAFSRSLANKAIKEQRTMTAEDAVADRDLMSMPSVQDLKLRSAMCVPFRAASGVGGALYVEHPGRRGAFGDREAEYLEALGDQAAIAVERMMHEEELARALADSRRDLAVAKRSLARRKAPRLIGESPPMDELRRQIDRFARSDLAVLVQGETGSGKELVARLVHERSARADGPFVSENCSAIPADLMESELFGHVKGAFTGADQDRAGLLELASGGTLFLDEVGDMPPEMQVKLLRALQEQRIRRVGGREAIPIDVRLVSATHRDLRAMIQEGTFREDLYFRIAAGVIRVPPLRERGDDVALLAKHFVERLNEEHGRKVVLDDATAGRLGAASFPGNVRELEHVIARAFLLTEGDTLEIEEDLARTADAAATDAPWPALPLAEAIYRTIHATLRATGGDKTAAARLLGISRTALYEKLKREATDRPGAD